MTGCMADYQAIRDTRASPTWVLATSACSAIGSCPGHSCSTMRPAGSCCRPGSLLHLNGRILITPSGTYLPQILRCLGPRRSTGWTSRNRRPTLDFQVSISTRSESTHRLIRSIPIPTALRNCLPSDRISQRIRLSRNQPLFFSWDQDLRVYRNEPAIPSGQRCSSSPAPEL
jgi:hypothetical protein